jgi:RNA polymerase sigma-70 factor (ECF subfamily)
MAGALVGLRGRPFAVAGFTVSNGRITEIDIVADPDKLPHLDLD